MLATLSWLSAFVVYFPLRSGALIKSDGYGPNHGRKTAGVENIIIFLDNRATGNIAGIALYVHSWPWYVYCIICDLEGV